MANQQTILIVDDDLHILEVLEARLLSAGFCVLKAASPKEALNLLKTHHPDLMISDMKMPDMSGMSLLTEVHSLHPGLPVIFLTAYGTIPDAVRAVKAGAVEYFTKPFDGRELIKKVQDVLKASAAPKKTVSTGHGFYPGQSRAMKELYEMIERVAASDVNVLVLGESGVGKERVARLIHDQGVRKDYPFVVVDCGSTPTGLLESELFGHVKGSFTHAIRDKKGLMEAAHTGTLFLDEIGNISSEMQVRLLRFLEDRKIRRIGDIREISVDCRVIAATNSNLADEIREGNFREDLYYRLRVVSLTIPPLRERKEDIPAFAQNFAEAFCKNKGIAPIKLLPETIEYLCRYRWPGNVRELKNALEGGIVLSQNGVLRSEDLQLARISENPGSPENPFSLDDSERDTIIRALRESGGVQKDAAELLGISRRAIHYKIKKYGIRISDIRANGR
ncbi:MAG TPA: sigma-54-dependent Fis family transcriptional regulator [Desulfobacteraceae bacterium]|nr:sigma-54-dependent Fis family transcriptional regulator [Desulfobacteraceae bacterium]